MTIAPPPTPRQKEVYYPSEDGKPLAETDKHADLMMHFKMSLQTRYADQPDVYVSGNNFIYYQEGNPKKCISPDCYVVFGVPKHQRDSYMSWREGGRLPNVIFEFTSRKTAKDDTDKKRPLYEDVFRVAEYFLFDPTGDYLEPRLQGFRLVEGRYQSIPVKNGRMHSEQLELDLVPEGETLRLFDPEQGVFLPTLLEATRRAEKETQHAVSEAQRAEQEAQRAERAEAENARLRAELDALRGNKP